MGGLGYSEFQFLIGRLDTGLGEMPVMAGMPFQFLIGRLDTSAFSPASSAIFSFNSS